jgi:hypothetical protein
MSEPRKESKEGKFTDGPIMSDGDHALYKKLRTSGRITFFRAGFCGGKLEDGSPCPKEIAKTKQFCSNKCAGISEASTKSEAEDEW